MKQVDFKVTFLSDIVLQASSNTEGNVEVLDFIPGSNFLGMVAKDYDKFEDPFEVFHSGKVRFGDATIMIDGKESFKVPLSYFKPKLGGDVKNHHLIEKFSAEEQLKQIRKGYITIDGEVVEPEYHYSQKSAYDKENRRSKEGAMYGYKAFKKGTTWKFSINYHDSINIEQVVEKLIGKKRLGKSKTAQYGSVYIEKTDMPKEQIEDFSKTTDAVVYLKSRLALFDTNGMPTYQPTPQNLGLSSEAEIDWTKCQLRINSYSPYNFKRAVKDYTRAVIQKGSVIVFKNLPKEDMQKLKEGVGGFLSEGFGEVLINPTFTRELYPKFVKLSSLKREQTGDSKIDDEVVAFLDNKRKQKKEIFEVSNKVQEFINRHKNLYKTVSKSQWGEIRAITHKPTSTDENIQKLVKEYIEKGVAKKQWEAGKEKLLSAIDGNLKFAKLLSMMMPKQKFEEESKDD